MSTRLFSSLLRAAILAALLLLPPSSAVGLSPASNSTDDILVHILGREISDRMSLTPDHTLLDIVVSGKRVATVAVGQSIDIQIESNEVHVATGSGSIQAPIIILRPVGEGSNTVRANRLERSYSGSLTISVRNDRLRIINRVPIEEYVASVVGSEYGFDDLEGSKAMAVVARTYAIRTSGVNGAGVPLVDDARAQVYRGREYITPVTRRAARETEGQVLTHDGIPIEAVYSASNGGHVAANESVWNTPPVAYLREREDPWDSISPYTEWTFEIDEEKLHEQLGDVYGLDVRDIDFGRPGRDGRVRRVTLQSRDGQRSISGSDFRAIVARENGERTLRSTYFKIDRKRDSYEFEGSGYGHGVGLSQWGARAMAGSGKSYTEILDFYYANVALESSVPGGPLLALGDDEPRAGGESGETDAPQSLPRPADAATAARTDAEVDPAMDELVARSPWEVLFADASGPDAAVTGRELTARNVWGRPESGMLARSGDDPYSRALSARSRGTSSNAPGARPGW